MITPTLASRLHAEIADHLRAPTPHPWRAYLFEAVRNSLAQAVPMLDAEDEGSRAATSEFLTLLADQVCPALAGCRTYMLDATLGHSLPAVLDGLDPDAPRCAPPEPHGIVWLATPMELPQPNGTSQRIDAVSWCTVDLDGHDTVIPAYLVMMWAWDGEQGPDTHWQVMLRLYRERHGVERPQSLGLFRMCSANLLPREQVNGPIRMEITDTLLDDLAETGQELVDVEALGASAIASAVFGTLTGELGALDAGGPRAVAQEDAEPNRAAVKRARRQGRPATVRTVSMGARLAPARDREPVAAPGTGSPLAVQCYTPGYYRRPYGSPPGTPRTHWVEGFWRGDASLPVSTNSTVYVARAPRPQWHTTESEAS
jgi:hypothetical protein